MNRESRHFTVEYHESEKECVAEVLNLLEDRYSTITKKLGKELKQKVIVQICSDRYELIHTLGLKNAPEWVRGGIAEGKTVIASPLNPPPGSSYHNVINTVVHEFVHVLLREINKDIPKWLDEGIASFEGKDNDETWIKDTILLGLKNGTVPTLDELDTGKDFERFFKIGGYQYSYAITEFVISVYGYEILMKLVKWPEKFDQIFQITKEEFYCKWIRYMEDYC